MAKVTLTISDVATSKEVLNAVRRAFSVDQKLKIGTTAQIKGVQVRVKEIPKSTRHSLEHIREWAAKQGIELGKRGRIPAEVMQAYAKKHK